MVFSRLETLAMRAFNVWKSLGVEYFRVGRLSVYKWVKCAVLLALLLTAGRIASAQSDWSAPDPGAVSKIEDEGLQRSHIMEVMSYLTDVYGPRLTNSPNIREAAEYAVKTLHSWGLANVHEESWTFWARLVE